MSPVSMSRRKAIPLTVVLSFVAFSFGGFLYFYKNSGGNPPWDRDGYTFSFRTEDSKNLVTSGEVRIAGVVVGRVAGTRIDGGDTLVEVRLDPEAAPLHDGVSVRVGLKSILGQSFLDVVDGDGAEIGSGATLPLEAVVPAVDVDEVLSLFNPQTQKQLKESLVGLGKATAGREDDVESIMAALGPIGSEGRVVVNALVDQSDSLESLIGEVDQVLTALDTSEGALADVVTDAQTITEATAPQATAIKQTIQALPSLLDNARAATDSLGGLSTNLTPVARDLRKSAPDLEEALSELPKTSADLRGLIPDLDRTLKLAPRTLDSVPEVSSQVRDLLVPAHSVLLDVVPMVEYIEPYGTDIGSFLGNFGASFDRPVENGVRPVSLAPIFNEYSVRNSPIRFVELNPLHWVNPYPAPMTADKPYKWSGRYPHVERLKP